MRPGAQWWGRNHVDNIDGGAMGPPVSSSATASSQNSGLPFSTDDTAVLLQADPFGERYDLAERCTVTLTVRTQ